MLWAGDQALVRGFIDGVALQMEYSDISTHFKLPAKLGFGTRVDFDPFPWESFAVWIMTQMKRWGQIKGEVDYAGVAKQVYLATDTTKFMKEVGLTPPATTSKKFVEEHVRVCLSLFFRDDVMDRAREIGLRL